MLLKIFYIIKNGFHVFLFSLCFLLHRMDRSDPRPFCSARDPAGSMSQGPSPVRAGWAVRALGVWRKPVAQPHEPPKGQRWDCVLRASSWWGPFSAAPSFCGWGGPSHWSATVVALVLGGSLEGVYFLFIYLFLERGEEKEKERERNISVWLPLERPLWWTWPATQACALTGNRTGNPLVHSPRSIYWARPVRACLLYF